MTKRTTGQLVSLAYVLHGAAESFAKPEVFVDLDLTNRMECEGVWIQTPEQREQLKKAKLPRGHAVIFLDGNKRNFDPDNLKLVTRAQLLALNRHNYQQQPDELKPSIFALALMECEGGFSTRYTRSGVSQQARWVHGR